MMNRNTNWPQGGSEKHPADFDIIVPLSQAEQNKRERRARIGNVNWDTITFPELRDLVHDIMIEMEMEGEQK